MAVTLDRLENDSGIDSSTNTLLTTARLSLDNIADDCRKAAAEFVDNLTKAGLAATVEEQHLQAHAPQYHYFEISLAVADPTPVIQQAQAWGFNAPIEPQGALWEAYRRSSTSVVLTKFDDATTRVRLHWSSQWTKSRVVRRFRPSLYGSAPDHLSAGWWPLVLLGAPLRKLVRQLTKSAPPSIGEWLGTPSCLFAELYAMADLQPDDRVLDIGCGDGRILIDAAKTYGCRGVGLEIDANLCREAAKNAADAKIDHLVEFQNVDARQVELEPADVVFLFLPVGVLGPMVSRLMDSMPHGTRIIAHEQAALTGVVPAAEVRPVFGERALSIAYRWTVGAEETP